METKTLKRAGVVFASIDALVAFFSALCSLWVTKWIFETWGVNLTATDAVFLFCFSIIIGNCFVITSTHIGVFANASDPLGYTAALSVFFHPLPPQGIVLMLFIFSSVSYCAGLVRVARLKKQGYVEK
jgi:hypothetical protein